MLQRDITSEVVRAVEYLTVANLGQLKQTVANNLRRQRGTVATHGEIDRAIANAIRTGHLTQDRNGDYRVDR